MGRAGGRDTGGRRNGAAEPRAGAGGKLRGVCAEASQSRHGAGGARFVRCRWQRGGCRGRQFARAGGGAGGFGAGRRAGKTERGAGQAVPAGRDPPLLSVRAR